MSAGAPMMLARSSACMALIVGLTTICLLSRFKLLFLGLAGCELPSLQQPFLLLPCLCEFGFATADSESVCASSPGSCEGASAGGANGAASLRGLSGGSAM